MHLRRFVLTVSISQFCLGDRKAHLSLRSKRGNEKRMGPHIPFKDTGDLSPPLWPQRHGSMAPPTPGVPYRVPAFNTGDAEESNKVLGATVQPSDPDGCWGWESQDTLTPLECSLALWAGWALRSQGILGPLELPEPVGRERMKGNNGLVKICYIAQRPLPSPKPVPSSKRK